MSTEAEKRLHRCCFFGQRPEKLKEDENTVKAWLRSEIEAALASGYRTFISGCAMGVDIWAAQIVLDFKADQHFEMGSSGIHLIAATPWPGFSNKWSIEWRAQYSDVLKGADLVISVSKYYHNDVFQQRNDWMVDHSSLVIAYYNGAPGGTRNAVEYAQRQGITVISNNPEYVEKTRKPRETVEESETIDYPENLVRAIGVEKLNATGEYTPLTEDQQTGLEHAIGMLHDRDRTVLALRYQEKKTFQDIGDTLGVSRQRAQQICTRAVDALRHPAKIIFIRDGFENAELSLKVKAAEEIMKQLGIQKKCYPLMNEEDVVKFVFQGMLGVGHLISDPDVALNRLLTEMAEAIPAEMPADEKLIEKISPQWVRMNLRAAKRDGIEVTDIACMLVESAKQKGLSFTRQNVYNFCVKMDESDRMNAAAEKVLDENWLPSHSEQYRAAYHPSYRVLHRDYRKFVKARD